MAICALTGHRLLPERFSVNALYDELEQLIQEGYMQFRCGMAMGFDLTALGCLVDLRQKYVFSIEACIPYAGHGEKFPLAVRKAYQTYLTWCDKKKILYPGFTRGCFLARDRYMVDGADLLFAYCVKEEGGAAYTVNYAKMHGVDVKYFQAE